MRSKIYLSTWINTLKISALSLFILLQNCVFHKSELKLKIINKSNDRLYIGNLLSSCDSCDIMRDVRFQCIDKISEQPTMRTLNAKDSLQLVDKLLPIPEKIYLIKADSLDKYCSSGSMNDISNKSWVQTLSGNVDMENKTCLLTIK